MVLSREHYCFKLFILDKPHREAVWGTTREATRASQQSSVASTGKITSHARSKARNSRDRENMVPQKDNTFSPQPPWLYAVGERAVCSHFVDEAIVTQDSCYREGCARFLSNHTSTLLNILPEFP